MIAPENQRISLSFSHARIGTCGLYDGLCWPPESVLRNNTPIIAPKILRFMTCHTDQNLQLIDEWRFGGTNNKIKNNCCPTFFNTTFVFHQKILTHFVAGQKALACYCPSPTDCIRGDIASPLNVWMVPGNPHRHQDIWGLHAQHARNLQTHLILCYFIYMYRDANH